MRERRNGGRREKGRDKGYIVLWELYCTGVGSQIDHIPADASALGSEGSNLSYAYISTAHHIRPTMPQNACPVTPPCCVFQIVLHQPIHDIAAEEIAVILSRRRLFQAVDCNIMSNVAQPGVDRS